MPPKAPSAPKPPKRPKQGSTLTHACGDGCHDDASPDAAEEAAASSRKADAYKQRKALNRSQAHTAVKCCLKKRVAPKAWDATRAAVDEAVLHVSKVTRRGSLVASLVTLELLKKGSLPDSFAANDTFLRNCFLVGLAGTNDGDMLADVRDVVSMHSDALAGQAVSRIPGDRQLITYAAQAYGVNFKNHVLVNHEKRLRAYVCAVLARHYGSVGRRWPKGLAFRAVKYVLNIWSHTSDLSFGSAPFDPVVMMELQKLREKHMQLLGDMGVRPKNLDVMRRTLELNYWILRRLEVLGGRQFGIAPLASIKRHHIKVDKPVFKDFFFPRLKAAGIFGANMRANVLEDDDIYEANLLSVFPKLRNLRSARMGWKPAAVIQTDGYSLCASFINLKKPAPSKEEKKLEGCLPVPSSLTGPTSTPDIGVDMGVVNVFYAAWEREDGTSGQRALTRAEYYRTGGIRRHTEIVGRRTKRVARVVEEMSTTAHRTWRSDRVAAYAAVCSANHAALWRELGDARLARSRMVEYMQKTKALDGFAKGLKQDCGVADPVVACGFPSYCCNAGGLPSAPTTAAFKRLRMYFKVVPTDEYNTSKYCHVCNSRLVAPRMKKNYSNGKVVEVRGIRLCNSTTCLELHGHQRHEWEPDRWRNYVRYARDKVGAANILRCGGKLHAQRPQCLQRPVRIVGLP